MDKRIRNFIIFFSLAFLVLAANLTYIQFFHSDELLASKFNTRSLAEELSIKRGSIITADKLEIARSERINNKSYKRFYPAGESFSNITGFYDSRYGRFALEHKYNNELLGRDKADTFSELIDRVAKSGQQGNDLFLTINSKIQRIAYRNLIGRRGAIVALEPKTGAILAMASYPGYNPNTIRKEWKSLISDNNSPLINRAASGLYPPGSTFKTVTLTAALENNKTTIDKMYPAPASLSVYGGKVTNYKNKGFSKISLEKAFQKSVNTVFAQVGLDIGGPALVSQAELFGFNRSFNFDLDYKKSLIKQAKDMDDLELAWTSVGQAHVLVTPLQMAMVALAIANDGVLMKPFLVEHLRDYQGKTIEKKQPKKLADVALKTNIDKVRNLMIKVVEKGTGRACALPYVKVAGKTGTAEVKGKPPHAWFIAFAPAFKPKIAIAVLVENGGTGGAKAAPIARQVIEEALKK